MAIVKVKSDIFGSVTNGAYVAPNGASRQGKITRVCGSVANLASDNSGSIYTICEIPSSAILLPESLILVDDWGYAQSVVGCVQDPDVLLDIATSGASATGNVLIAKFGATWNKPFWEQCGLSADPLVPMQLQLIAEADAAGAGSAKFDLHFANHI